VPGLPDGSAYGIRLSLADVKGINAAEVERVVAGRPYGSLSDFWHRARVARPVVERLVVAGAFDSLYGIGLSSPVRRRGRVTRRDLLLQVADLDRHTRATTRAAKASAPRGRRTMPLSVDPSGPVVSASTDTVAAARRQAQGPATATAAADLDVQLALDLGDAPGEVASSGLPEMTDAERVRAELEVLGLDASRHVVDFYVPMLEALGVTRSRDLLRRRNQSEILVAGVKVATQTPPVRSGRRVVFLTLDDATGPVDATFFEDVQGPYAATVFGSWLLLVRGLVRRTGPRGISIRATGAWELGVVHEAWRRGGIPAVAALLGADAGTLAEGDDGAIAGRAESRSSRPVTSRTPSAGGGMGQKGSELAGEERAERARRVLVHASGFRQSPYADIKPQGVDAADTRGQAAAREAEKQAEKAAETKPPPSKLWHSSPGSSGW
jgi:error-prone DNA polymerase